MFKALVATATLSTAVGSASAGYLQVYDFDTANAGGSSAVLYGVAPAGNGFYNFLSLNSSPRVTFTSPDGSGGFTTTEVMSTSQWTAAGGTTFALPFYGFGVSGGVLQFADSGSDAVWRVDPTTGTPTAYVTKAQLQAFSVNAPQLGTSQAVAPDGEHVFFEGRSDSLLRTTGSGTFEVLLSATRLADEAGGNLQGGLTYDADGRLIFGGNDDRIYAFDESADTLNALIGAAAIRAALGLAEDANLAINDIFAAPDGWVYFQENTQKSVLRFEADDPTTLSVFLSGAELAAGPMATDSPTIGQFTWYDGNLAWSTASTTDGIQQGFYVVPEPTSLALLSVGALLLRRRRAAVTRGRA